MTLLRRVLWTGGMLVAVLSLLLIVVPGAIVEGILGQDPVADDVWIRLFGTAGVTLGLFHVLILRKLEDLWWWCWAFVIFDGLSAVVVIVHAVIGLPEGSAAWPWWVYGLGSAVLAALYLGGLARAGQEKPFA
jgi:hypothetical protein